MQSSAASTSHTISISALTTESPAVDPGQWLEKIKSIAAENSKADQAQAYWEHLQWWDAFWNRSWVFIQNGTDPVDATNVTRGYLLQRFKTACAGRGMYPIKFNGSLFNVDMPALPNGKR